MHASVILKITTIAFNTSCGQMQRTYSGAIISEIIKAAKIWGIDSTRVHGKGVLMAKPDPYK